MGQPKTTDSEKMSRAAEDLRELIREAHAATKDMRSTIRDLRESRDHLIAIIDSFNDLCQKECDKQFRVLQEYVTETMKQADHDIHEQFGRVKREIFDPSVEGNHISLQNLTIAKKVVDSILWMKAKEHYGEDKLDTLVDKLASNIVSVEAAKSGLLAVVKKP